MSSPNAVVKPHKDHFDVTFLCCERGGAVNLRNEELAAAIVKKHECPEPDEWARSLSDPTLAAGVRMLTSMVDNLRHQLDEAERRLERLVCEASRRRTMRAKGVTP